MARASVRGGKAAHWKPGADGQSLSRRPRGELDRAARCVSARGDPDARSMQAVRQVHAAGARGGNEERAADAKARVLRSVCRAQARARSAETDLRKTHSGAESAPARVLQRGARGAQ